MKNIIAIFTLFIVIGLASLNMGIAGAATHQGHGQAHTRSEAAVEKTSPEGTFKHESVMNHVRAEFQIMSLKSMNMKDPNGATHHVMVNLFHDSTNHPIKDAVGKVKIIDPNGKEQINPLKNHSGIYAANFTIEKNGKYGVICLLKVDGESHVFKFWYPHG